MPATIIVKMQQVARRPLAAAVALGVSVSPALTDAVAVGGPAQVCNRDSAASFVRDVPGAKRFENVAEIANGTPLAVIDLVTDSTGARYALVEFSDPKGTGILAGFLNQDEMAAPSCPSEFVAANPAAGTESGAGNPSAAAGDTLPADILHGIATIPPNTRGWMSGINPKIEVAASWYGGEAGALVSFVCSRKSGFRIMAFRVPPEVIGRTNLTTGALGIGIEDDVPWTAELDGVTETVTGGTWFSKLDLIDDPGPSGGKLAIAIDAKPDNNDDTYSKSFMDAQKKTIIHFYDPAVEPPPTKEQIAKSIAIRANGSTASFRETNAYCGIDPKG